MPCVANGVLCHTLYNEDRVHRCILVGPHAANDCRCRCGKRYLAVFGGWVTVATPGIPFAPKLEFLSWKTTPGQPLEGVVCYRDGDTVYTYKLQLVRADWKSGVHVGGSMPDQEW